MTLFRSYLAIALALLIGLTSQELALMRGQPQASGEVILCTGTGPVSVAVDANGEPTGPAHFCPDCAMTLMVGLTDHPVEVVQVVHMSTLVFQVAGTTQKPFIHIAQSARGPPLTV